MDWAQSIIILVKQWFLFEKENADPKWLNCFKHLLTNIQQEQSM